MFCVFVSTDGEACSAKVTTSLNETYSVSGSIAYYNNRNAYVGCEYVATWAIPQISLLVTPRHLSDVNGATLRTFTWSPKSVIVNPNTIIAFSNINYTSVSYGIGNQVSFSTTYMVGHRDYMILPYFTYKVSLPLKI